MRASTEYGLALLTLASCGMATLGVGCAKERERPKIVEVEGVVADIDHVKGTVTVRVYREKHKREVERTVFITGETEILINGGLATLADVRIGEKAVGSIRSERDGDEKRYVALSVSIERAEVLVAPETKTPPAEPPTSAEPKESTDQTQ